MIYGYYILRLNAPVESFWGWISKPEEPRLSDHKRIDFIDKMPKPILKGRGRMILPRIRDAP